MRYLAILMLGSCLYATGFAIDPDTKTNASVRWDPSRTTSPETVYELRALESTVKEVAAKVKPATVGLFIRNTAGSGVIVSEDGLVLTAAHVIGKTGQKVQVMLNNGKAVNGVALGLNSKLDSGMLKITDPPPKGSDWIGAIDGKWPAVELGSSANIKKGQWLLSLGHHGGFVPGRTAPVRLGRFDYYNQRERTLRSDCVLVGGDSGGPLFDLEGKLVGIHSKIGIFIDFNHHIAIDAFRDEWDKLANANQPKESTTTTEEPKVSLGVFLDKELNAPTVIEVIPDSPAEKAGIKVGDVILKVDGELVRTRDELRKAIMAFEPDSRVVIQILRNERRMTLRVRLSAEND